MAVIKVKPTSPGRRAVVKVVHKHLHKGKPEASLLEPQIQNAGRNNRGIITMRHKGGGHKHHYRVVDFKRTKDSVPAKVERIEYDPNRTAHIALLCYADGERRYIIAPRGVATSARRSCCPCVRRLRSRPGNCLPVRNIPVGTIDPLRRDGCRARAPRSPARPAPRVTAARPRRRLCPGAFALGRRYASVHVDCRAVDRRGRQRRAQPPVSIGKAGANRWKRHPSHGPWCMAV